ncbi:hypothetical protein [Streptomyces sp. IBSNAI001]|uniref:hypothetical protein n=1 Tax=Streptomyces sp. IBSNAI001 TaxID=3457499 RepID=UPI003FD444EE
MTTPTSNSGSVASAQAGGLLAQWRSPADALLPRLVARLDDPAAEVRFRAAELLACLGPAAAAHADEVAALIGDTGAPRPHAHGRPSPRPPCGRSPG